VPIAIVLFILSFIRLEESSDPSPGRLDLLGTIILSFAILSLMFGLTNIYVDFWASFKQIEVSGFIGVGIVLFIVLMIYESAFERKENGDPIFPIFLVKQPRFLMVLLIGALSGGILASMIFIPAFTENVLGITAEKSGYWMTPLALAAGIGAGLGGTLVTKRGPVFAVIMSGLIAAIGFALFPLWIETKWQFVISSMIAGVGIGVILGAPLNILATEGLKSNKGSALATLSLLRQIGMTLAPTIYAGFIARSFNNIGNLFKNDFQEVLQDNIAKANLSREALDELSQIGRQMASSSGSIDTNQINDIIGSIQDPALKEVVFNSVSEITKRAAENGYGGLYWLAAILGVLVIIASTVLIPLRKKGSALDAEKG
jgi:MFS family permease